MTPPPKNMKSPSPPCSGKMRPGVRCRGSGATVSEEGISRGIFCTPVKRALAPVPALPTRSGLSSALAPPTPEA